MTDKLFTIPGLYINGAEFGLSVRDLVLFLGGLYLIYKGIVELRDVLKLSEEKESQGDADKPRKTIGLAGAVATIMVMDIVFSIDSVITAVGLANHLIVMIIAVMLLSLIHIFGVKENPAGSNHVKYGEWYGLDYNPWCDMFVSWCADQVGALGIVGKFAYCPSHVNHAKKLGRWLDREEKPQKGDIVFFSNGSRACHVGIVESRNGSASVTTIEGNTSVSSNDNGGAVMRRTRSYGVKGSNWFIMG